MGGADGCVDSVFARILDKDQCVYHLTMYVLVLTAGRTQRRSLQYRD